MAAVISGCLLIAAASHFIFRAQPPVEKAAAPHVDGFNALLSHAPTVSAASAVSSAGAADVQGAGSDAAAVKPFTAEEAVASLRGFVDKILKRDKLSSAEVEELQARLLASIESDPAVAKAVGQFYHDMPADQAMERDMLRSLLVGSSDGRGIVLQEANVIWASQSESKFGEMYETYFNLPGQVPQDVIVRALADLKAGARTDERTAVARLNFIGTLAEQKNGDAANLRGDALPLLNQVAEGQGSDIVRALAVQKLYRLSSPAEASNIAVAQLSKGASSDLVRETLSSVTSGDVELTPNLRAALATAVKRPAASAEEKQQFSQVLGTRG